MKGLGGASSLGPSHLDDFSNKQIGAHHRNCFFPSYANIRIHQGGLKGCRSWFWFNGGGAITPDTWPWGWTSLDRLWRLVLGEVTVVTGIPGHGKSEFLLSLAVSWWSWGGNIGIQENWGWKHLVVKGSLFTNKSTGMSQEFWTLL